MTDIQIDALSPAGTLTGNENTAISQAGVTVRTNITGLTSFAVAQATAAAQGYANQAAASATAAAASASAFNNLFDQTSLRYAFGKKMLATVADANLEMGLGLAEDGFFYAKHAIQVGAVANGLTFTRSTLTGFYSIQLGSVQGQLPLGSAGDMIDTTELRYYAGKAVAWDVRDVNGRASIINTIDGDVYIPNLVLGANQTNNLDKALDTTSWLFSSAKVGSAWQIFRTSKSSWGQPVQTTFTGNNLNPVISADGANIIYSSDRLGGRDLFYQPTGGLVNGKDHPVFPTTGAFYCLGDSLTQGGEGNSGAGAYPVYLASLLGRTATNAGIGGQKSTQIAMRYGAVSCWLTFGGSSVTTGANSVADIGSTSSNGIPVGAWPGNVDPDYRLLSTAASSGNFSCTGTLISGATSVHGILARSVTGGTTEVYSFTPDASASGLPLSVSGAVQFLVDTFGYDDELAVFWLGRNNYTQTAQVTSDVNACAAWFKPLAKRFVVMGVLIGRYSSEASGQANYTTITGYNSSLYAAYPNNSVDPNAALLAAANMSDPLDAYLHGLGQPPASLAAVTTGSSFSANVAAGDTTFSWSGTASVYGGAILRIGTGEAIYINSVSGSTVTSCVRGFGGTTAAAYTSGQAFNVLDPIHLNGSGYNVIATALYNFISGKNW
jgi:hypothetical protein